MPTRDQIFSSPGLSDRFAGCGPILGDSFSAASGGNALAAARATATGEGDWRLPCEGGRTGDCGFAWTGAAGGGCVVPGCANGFVGPDPPTGTITPGTGTGFVALVSSMFTLLVLPENWSVVRGVVNGSPGTRDSMRGDTPRKVMLLIVPTHIGARSSSVMSAMRMMCG